MLREGSTNFIIFWKFVFGSLLFKTLASVSPHSDDNNWQCAPRIELDFCKGTINYTETINMSPSSLNPYTDKDSQENSKRELGQYVLLLKTGCSKHLRLLLCSVYLPYCNPKFSKPITACRTLCEEVKSKCFKYMKSYYPWPPHLNCSKFIEKNSESNLCVDGDIRKSPRRPTSPILQKNYSDKTTPKKIATMPRLSTHHIPNHDITQITSRRTFCRVLYSRNSKNYFYVEKLQACTLECMKDGLFTLSEKRLAEKWLSALSCICGLLCVVALFVVVFDYHRTCYPERTIVFIAVCYLFYSLAYVIRIVYSREGISCQEEHGRRYLLIDGSGNISCAATFLLGYCFTMAQNIWWVMMSLSWFLSAGMKWSGSSIKKYSSYFHIVAWGVPCVLTVVILVLRKIDINELTGVCSIGNRYENLSALRGFVLGPLFTYLITGVMFLMFGFVTLLKVSQCHDEAISQTKLKRPLLPIGIYAALHTFFSTFVLATYFYEYINKNDWYHDPTSSGPNFEMFLVRIIMDFLIGIVAAIWLLVVHAPHLYNKFRVKLYKHEFISDPSEHSALNGIKTEAGTNETSI